MRIFGIHGHVLRGCCLMIGAAAASGASAQTVLVTNGQIYTPRGWVEAMAVVDGKIAALGRNADVRRKAAADVTTVDLRGRTVMPGLADMHVHPMLAGQAAQECRIEQNSNGPALLATLAACVRGKKPGEWVVGGQYVADNLRGTRLTRETLDQVSPDNPVMLMANSFHDAWANSKALAAAGIDRNTPDPEGGVIQRDSRGEPTGILQETAKALVQVGIPPQSAEQNAAALKFGLDRLLAYGVTLVNDALLLPPTIAAYDQLADQGLLKQHVLGCSAYNQSLVPLSNEAFQAMVANHKMYARPNFSASCVKVFMDGTPTEGRTAAFIEPYVHAESKAASHGMLLVDGKTLSRLVTGWDEAGLVVKFHAAGDQAARSALDAIEAARKANGRLGPRHIVGHSSFVTPQDLTRARALNATLEFSPFVWFPLPTVSDIANGVGPQRMRHIFPMKSALRSSALIVAGSDWPVVPDPNPWPAIESAVTRKAPGGSGETVGAPEALTLKEAIGMFTINAARALGMERERGSLEVGKSADFVVVDRNPFRIPENQVGQVRTLQVFIDGKEVYRAAP